VKRAPFHRGQEIGGVSPDLISATPLIEQPGHRPTRVAQRDKTEAK
jgi:hypothetical protein